MVPSDGVGIWATTQDPDSLDRTEMWNGFANRFLIGLVRRSKYLPLGGQLKPDVLPDLIERLKQAIKFARTVGQIRFDHQATNLWCDVYQELSSAKPGAFGAITARAEAQVLRLAAIFSLLDLSDIIRVEHLKAALGLWAYCEESCRKLFGDLSGDDTADRILRELRLNPGGMSRTEINRLFKGHRKLFRIQNALDLLTQRELVRSEKRQTTGVKGENLFETLIQAGCR